MSVPIQEQLSARLAELSTRHLGTPDASDNQVERYVLQSPEHEILKLSHAYSKNLWKFRLGIFVQDNESVEQDLKYTARKKWLRVRAVFFRATHRLGRTRSIQNFREVLTVRFELEQYQRVTNKSKIFNQ